MFAVSYLRSVKLFMLTAVAVVLCNAIANGIVAEAQETSEYHWKLSAVRPLRCDRLDQFQTFDREAAQRQDRPRRFLDLFVYQLLALRTYVRAWADKYKDSGPVVIGVHTPEFDLESGHL